MKKVIAIIKDSFKITGKGIIINLKHSEKGLKKEQLLISNKSGLAWKVASRVLFDHAVHKQIIFENESVNHMLTKFENQSKEKESVKKITEDEAQGIFLYLIKPIRHNNRPSEFEELLIK